MWREEPYAFTGMLLSDGVYFICAWSFWACGVADGSIGRLWTQQTSHPSLPSNPRYRHLRIRRIHDDPDPHVGLGRSEGRPESQRHAKLNKRYISQTLACHRLPSPVSAPRWTTLAHAREVALRSTSPFATCPRASRTMSRRQATSPTSRYRFRTSTASPTSRNRLRSSTQPFPSPSTPAHWRRQLGPLLSSAWSLSCTGLTRAFGLSKPKSRKWTGTERPRGGASRKRASSSKSKHVLHA